MKINLNDLIDKVISPSNLKKFGVYAFLSFFMITTLILGFELISTGRKDKEYEREQRERVIELLLEQRQLKRQQEQLLNEKQIISDSLN